MKYLRIAAALLLFSSAAMADRDTGWDYGADVIYSFSQDIGFDGGSRANIDDDLGLALSFGYRFSSRFELLFTLDWNNSDYDLHVAPGDVAAGNGFNATGEIESWTPRVGVNFNLLEGPLTPYLTGAVGWSFIDTNIPDSPPQTACWWDPWWGYYCGTYQDTRNIDELVYDIGAGVRWDVGSTWSLRLGYERHWIDLGNATSTPGFDQVRFGVSARY
ncbi:MAG TPA: outer membrane beta-barrel protein [Povalibacter sp.]|jgi:opacity protein-like surface antigen|nr:outer membrane beta-barrel protein [Povalibacter sp.]